MYQYKIAEARMAKGWSQQDLANAVGISQPAIQRYETGARDIKSGMLIKLSSVLGVTVSYLLGLDNEPLEPNGFLNELQTMNQYKMSSPNCRDCMIRVITEMAKH